MTSVTSTTGSTQGWVLNPDVEIVKTTKIVTENGAVHEITTYPAASNQSIEDIADNPLKDVGMAVVGLGVIGLIMLVLSGLGVGQFDNSRRRSVLLGSCGLIAGGLTMVIFSRSVYLPPK